MKSSLTFTPADRYIDRNKYSELFGVPKYWPKKKWVHLVHNWRTGGSSLTALLSVNFHDSYLKVGHPFTRDGWPVDYKLHPLQITTAPQLSEWIRSQPHPAILAGHTYAGMANGLSVNDYDLWVTMRDPAARMNSGLLRFHRKALKSDHPGGGYVGSTKGFEFSSAAETEHVIRTHLSHEINGMCRRLAGYSALSSNKSFNSDLESCAVLDERPVDQATFDIAVDRLKSCSWIYLTDHVLPSLLILETGYSLKPLLHPCSDLKHNPQWNGSGITRMHQSLLTNYRELFENINSWDVKLYAIAKDIFWSRWKEYGISSDQLQARRLLQSKPLFHPKLLSSDIDSLRQSILNRIQRRSLKASSKSISNYIVQDGISAQFWNPSSASTS